MNLRPVTLAEANAHVGKWHRHNLPVRGCVATVGAELDGALVAVGILGRPVARALQDGVTAEITRVASDGTPNACSMVYGALLRAARALGYRRVFTYTLQSEPGSSLRACGAVRDAELATRPAWAYTGQVRVQTDLFGTDRRPPGPKVRWRWDL